MIKINRNVTIVVIILVLVVIAGYLVWFRSKFQAPVSPQVEVQVTATPSPTNTASPSATPMLKSATPSSARR